MKRLLVVLPCLLLALGGSVSGQTAKQVQDVQALIKTLQTSKDAKARAAAATGIAGYGQIKLILVKPAEAPLIDALKDENPEVRRAAVLALTIIEPYQKDRIPGLMGLLKDSEPGDTRGTAIVMLGQIDGGAPQAVPVLEDILKREVAKDEKMRNGDLINRTSQSLTGIRQHLLVGWIATVKDGKDAKARVAASAELIKVAQTNAEQAKAAIPALVEALRDEDAEVRKNALTALTIAKPEPQTVMPGLIAVVKNLREDRAVRLAAIGMLTALGPNAREAVPYLEILHKREEKKEEADRDKELFEKLTAAIEAIKKQ